MTGVHTYTAGPRTEQTVEQRVVQRFASWSQGLSNKVFNFQCLLQTHTGPLRVSKWSKQVLGVLQGPIGLGPSLGPSLLAHSTPAGRSVVALPKSPLRCLNSLQLCSSQQEKQACEVPLRLQCTKRSRSSR